MVSIFCAVGHIIHFCFQQYQIFFSSYDKSKWIHTPAPNLNVVLVCRLILDALTLPYCLMDMYEVAYLTSQFVPFSALMLWYAWAGCAKAE